MKKLGRYFLITVLALAFALSLAGCGGGGDGGGGGKGSDEEKNYIITFNTQGGTGGTQSVVATSNADMPQAIAPTKTGNEFGGYFDQIGGEGGKYYNADMTSAKKWDKSEDTTLYAHWIPLAWNATGSGTSQSPYIISNEKQLISLASLAQNSFNNIHFALGADINLGDVEWTPIGSEDYPFRGTFNGNGHKISNFKITTAYDNVGLFGYNEGNILNLGVDSFTVDIDDTKDIVSAGGLVGFNNYGTITDCFAKGSISVKCLGSTYTYIYAAGLIGSNTGDITGCYAATSISIQSLGTDDAYAFTGGLVGANDSGTITSCYTTGDVSTIAASLNGAGIFSGGLIGYNYHGTTKSSYASGDVSVDCLTDQNAYVIVGGLIGVEEFCTLIGSYASGDVNAVTPTGAIGGLIGDSYESTITNGYFYENQTIKINGELFQNNDLGSPCTLAQLNSSSFYTDTLSWGADIWDFSTLDFENGKYPTLKA